MHFIVTQYELQQFIHWFSAPRFEIVFQQLPYFVSVPQNISIICLIVIEVIRILIIPFITSWNTKLCKTQQVKLF